MPVSAPLDLLSDVLAQARKAGAGAADAVLVDQAALSAARRLGRSEGIERAESAEVGLRVLMGRRQAVASSTDLSAEGLARLTGQAVAMARAAPEDPWCGLADPETLARAFPELDIAEAGEPAPERLDQRAAAAEDAAMAVAGITNSEGAEAGWSRTTVALAATNGFAGSYTMSRHGVSVSVLAGAGTAMERDYDYDTATYGGDLRDPAEIGRNAAERAVRRLGPRKAATARVPVVFENRVAGSLLRALAGAISGPAVARGTSFLKSTLGTQVFAEGIAVIDDPHRRRGLRSKPFDGEGVANARRALVEGGVLASWLLDSASARQLGLPTTGHAARGTSGPPAPAPTNLYLEPGAPDLESLIGGIARGVLVTELMGMGVNPVTGDYSRGAAGFWIEGGAIAHPVSEITIAGNLRDMFRNLSPGSDLVFRSGTDAPSLLVEGMTVAGT
ncbi:MAG TPA: metallopeptidase TldD-related protein [Alphaproteobacteria bacterium]